MVPVKRPNSVRFLILPWHVRTLLQSERPEGSAKTWGGHVAWPAPLAALVFYGSAAG